MKILRQKYEQLEEMSRINFELTHLHDTIPDKVEFHSHDFYELCFVVSGGNIQYRVEDQLYQVRPGDVYMVDCFCKHGTFVNRSAIYDRILIWISPEYLDGLGTKETDLSYCFKQALSQRKNILRLGRLELANLKETLFKLEKAYFSLSKGSDVLTKIYLSELLMILNLAAWSVQAEPVENDAKANNLIDNVLEYINNNLNDNLNLDSLAKKFFISRHHLMRIFKISIGYTVHQYIMMQRYELAKKYLEEGIPPSQASINCGFTNYTTFHQGFTKWYGMTPKQYTKQTRLFQIK